MDALVHELSITETGRSPTNADGKLTWKVDVELDGHHVHRNLILVDPHTEAEHDQCRQYLDQLLAKEQAIDMKISNAKKHQRQSSVAKHTEKKHQLQVEADNISSAIDRYRRNLYQQLHIPTSRLVEPSLRIDVREHSTKQTLPGTRTIHFLHWEQLEASEFWGASSTAEVVVRRIVDQLCQPSGSSDESLEPAIQHIRSWPPRDHRKPSLNVLLVVARDLSEYPSIQNHRRSSPATSMQDTDPSLAQLAILRVREMLQLSKRVHRVQLTIVRPGTFEALGQHLREISETYGKGYYSIIHFDVHGRVFKEDNSVEPQHTAYLQFPHPESGTLTGRSALDVANLVQKHKIPCAVINACDSAAASKGINANLGRIFIRTGIPNVVAMSHKFSSDASALFQTSFYNAFLSETRPFSEAVAIARRDLRENMIRRGGDTGGTKVQDWFVPVVYTNGREVQVTVTGNSGPRLSWPSQLSGQKTKGRSITSIRERTSIIRHQCAALRVVCAALRQICRSAYQNSSRRDILKLPSIVNRHIGDELNLLALDTDILKLENNLIEDRVVVLYGSADSLHSIKLRRLARLWLSTNFVEEVQYVDARQFLEESPRLSERLKPQRLVQSPKVDEFYPLAKSIHSGTRASRPSVVLIIDRMNELFSPARPDERYRQGQQKLKDLLDRLPKKVAGYYPSQMPYLLLAGPGDPEWWRRQFDDIEMDWTFRKCHERASYHRLV